MKKYRLNKEKLFKNIKYVPQKAQLDMHDSEARFRVDCSGRRRGKSFMAGREALPYLLVPGSRGCVVAPTYDLSNKVMREIDKVVFGQLKIPTHHIKRIEGQLRYASLNLGPSKKHAAEVWSRSADNPDSILGEGYDWVVVDEAARISKVVIDQYLRPTMSDRKGFAVYISTPNGFNWFYDYWKRGQSKNIKWKSWASWQHPSSVSKYISKDEINSVRGEMAPLFFRQEYGAEFVAFAGQVYGDFIPAIHAKMEILYDARCELYCFIDFGYRMPAVLWAQLIYTDQGPKLIIIDEILHQPNISTPALKMKILARNAQMQYKVERYFGDPAGTGMQSGSGTSDVKIFADPDVGGEVIKVRLRKDKVATNIDNGVKTVRAMIYNASGIVSLFVSKTCIGMIEDLKKYHYPEKKDESSPDKKEIPVKDGYCDHGCDALRIGIVNLARKFPNIVYIKGLVK